ncbi:MAG: fibronectin type III domain-containing protein, partial [Microgenomates group bacterium]
MTIKRNKLPTLLGLVILVAATFLGVFLLNGQQIFRLGASGESSPKDIRTSNITDTSLTISWSTDKAVSGFINWGTSSSSVTNIEKENDEKSFTHSVTVNGLAPEKIVYFKINSDGSVYDKKGIPWQISTGATLGINKSSILLSGSIIVATGEPVRKALVYANVGGYLFSTLTSDTGNYVFQLANTRTQDLSNYLTINESQTLVEIFVQAPPNGVSSAQIVPQSGKSA